MPKFFQKTEEISAGIGLIIDRKLLHSGSVKSGKLNRKQYKTLFKVNTHKNRSLLLQSALKNGSSGK